MLRDVPVAPQPLAPQLAEVPQPVQELQPVQEPVEALQPTVPIAPLADLAVAGGSREPDFSVPGSSRDS